MLESTVERHLREEAKKRNGLALKFVSPEMCIRDSLLLSIVNLQSVTVEKI